jgi:hypothetical protein
LLGPNKVVIQITDLLVQRGRTADWMFTNWAWKVINTFYGVQAYTITIK